MEELTLKEKFENDGHIYHAYDWDISDGWKERLSEKIIPLIKQLYLDCEGLTKNLEETGLDKERIEKFIKESQKVAIPKNSKNPNNLSVRRSDFAEIIALICLEGLHDTIIPVRSIANRELSHVTGRGVDILGYEENNGNVALILCEVKGSSDASSPPAVVDRSEDSMKNQLFSYISNRKKTHERILRIQMKSKKPEHKKMLAKIALWWSQNDDTSLKVIVCPFLVRKGDLYKNTDYGFFKTEPDYFKPGKIRFLIVCLHEDLNSLSNMIYDKAVDENGK